MTKKDSERNIITPGASSFSRDDNSKAIAIIAAVLIAVLIAVTLIIGLNKKDNNNLAAEGESLEEDQVASVGQESGREPEKIEEERDTFIDNSEDPEEMFEITSSADLPLVFIESLKKSEANDWVLDIGLQDFSFSSNAENDDGDGYVSVLVNSIEVTKSFKNQYVFSTLSEGDEVKLVLTTNDNKSYAFDKQIIQDVMIIGGPGVATPQTDVEDVVPDGDPGQS